MIFFVFFSLFILVTFIIYFFQEKLIFYPEVLMPDHVYEFDVDFDEKYFIVDEGIKINALHFRVPNSKGVILYAHGNAGSLRNWGLVSGIFSKFGYDVLVYDYRGYGKSGGSISEKSLYKDAQILYSSLLSEYDEQNIIVYGRSIGTGIASYIAATNHPGHLILESPYYNLPDLARKIFPFIPKVLIRYKFRNDQLIANVKCPLTIFHGTFDQVVYFGSSLKLEKNFKKEDRLVPIVGGHHNDLSNFEIYHQTLAAILK